MDAWVNVCVFLTIAQLRELACVSHALCDAVCAHTHGARLSRLLDRMNQKQVTRALCMSDTEVKAMPFAVEECGYGMHQYIRHAFRFSDVLCALGGWAAVAAAVTRGTAKEAERLARSADLTERRKVACVKRTQCLDEWLARELPLGPNATSVAAWRASLVARGLTDPLGTSLRPFTDRDSYCTLRRFLRPEILTGPTIDNARTALLRYEAAEEAQHQRIQKFEQARKLKRRRDERKTWSGSLRHCTTPGCRNTHRKNEPATGPNGPVCGACERAV